MADDLTRPQVERTLRQYELIADYPLLHRPLPNCLILGRLTSDQPIHAVIAVDVERDRVFVVTVYRSSAEEWKEDWRTRKS